jgi:peroxiredoxin
MKTTTDELHDARTYYRTEVIPPAALRVMDAATEALVQSGLLNQALGAGDAAPDFILPDTQGKPVRLYDLLEKGPAVVVFYRGGWCPYCNIHLRGFQRVLPQLAKMGAALIAISPQVPDRSLTTKEKDELMFPVLSDVGLHVARSFGVAFELPADLLARYEAFGHGLDVMNGPLGAKELPVPATFVVDREARILLAHVDADYTSRLDPVEAVRALYAKV